MSIMYVVRDADQNDSVVECFNDEAEAVKYVDDLRNEKVSLLGIFADDDFL